MIEYINGVFGLHTDGISCLLRVNEYGLIELLHFGQSAGMDRNDRRNTLGGAALCIKLHILDIHTLCHAHLLLSGYCFSQIRSFALRERGLASNSSSVATMGFRLINFT